MSYIYLLPLLAYCYYASEIVFWTEKRWSFIKPSYRLRPRYARTVQHAHRS